MSWKDINRATFVDDFSPDVYYKTRNVDLTSDCIILKLRSSILRGRRPTECHMEIYCLSTVSGRRLM